MFSLSPSPPPSTPLLSPRSLHVNISCSTSLTPHSIHNPSSKSVLSILPCLRLLTLEPTLSKPHIFHFHLHFNPDLLRLFFSCLILVCHITYLSCLFRLSISSALSDRTRSFVGAGRILSLYRLFISSFFHCLLSRIFSPHQSFRCFLFLSSTSFVHSMAWHGRITHATHLHFVTSFQTLH